LLVGVLMEVSTRAVIPFKMTPSRKRLISWADGFRGLRIGDVTALNGNVPAIKSGKHLPLFDHHTTKSLFFGISMAVSITVVGEITDASNAAQAFALLPLFHAVGGIVSPRPFPVPRHIRRLQQTHQGGWVMWYIV
jgi:hypothetical protein